MTNTHLYIKNKLYDIINNLKPELSNSEIEFINSGIHVGNYNLALEILCDILIEKEISIDLKTYELIHDICITLNLETHNSDILKSQIIY